MIGKNLELNFKYISIRIKLKLVRQKTEQGKCLARYYYFITNAKRRSRRERLFLRLFLFFNFGEGDFLCGVLDGDVYFRRVRTL